MGVSHATRRARDGAISLYPAETSLGWRVIGTTTATRAAEKLAKGEWREVVDENQNFLGYQVMANFKKDEDLPSGASSSSITGRECELNAGRIFLHGRSHTAGLAEEKRISRKSRFGKRLPPEDAVELAMCKVEMWPFPASRVDGGSGQPVYGDRAVRCYPKPG